MLGLKLIHVSKRAKDELLKCVLVFGNSQMFCPWWRICSIFVCDNYRQTSDISHSKSQHLNFLFSSCSCLCPIHWSPALSRKWRYSRGNYIRMINDFFVYQCASNIRGLTVDSGFTSLMRSRHLSFKNKLWHRVRNIVAQGEEYCPIRKNDMPVKLIRE